MRPRMGNANLTEAKRAKNDEFYTQYADIEAEMNAYIEFDHDVFRGKIILCPCDDPEWSNFTRYFAANFTRLGLRKLISTSYAKGAANRQPTLFELESPQYDEGKHETRGRIYMLDRDTNQSGRIDIDDLKWDYLQGDGDFRSDEVTRLRDEADFIITNPPFSLFREFLSWILDGDKKFAIIGNQNAITYKEVFPLIRNDRIWLGSNQGGSHKGNSMYFIVLDDYSSQYIESHDGNRYMQTTGKWFTNIDHGLRHEPLKLDTMAHNLKYNRRLRRKLESYGTDTYPMYDNYNAIEVPYTDAIPSDYMGAIGVPITFMDKYCPEQFELLDCNDYRRCGSVPVKNTMLVKDKEAGITIPNDGAERERERERERENGRTGGRRTRASSSDGGVDMVARPIIGDRETYRRILIRARVEAGGRRSRRHPGRTGAVLGRDGRADHVPGQIQPRTIRDRRSDRK